MIWFGEKQHTLWRNQSETRFGRAADNRMRAAACKLINADDRNSLNWRTCVRARVVLLCCVGVCLPSANSRLLTHRPHHISLRLFLSIRRALAYLPARAKWSARRWLRRSPSGARNDSRRATLSVCFSCNFAVWRARKGNDATRSQG